MLRCIAEVSSARRLGRKRARIAKELASRVTALRELLKQHDAKNPIGPDGTPNNTAGGLASGFNTPVFNPLKDHGTQCEQAVMCETSSECLLLNGRNLSVQHLSRAMHHMRLRRMLENLLRSLVTVTKNSLSACMFLVVLTLLFCSGTRCLLCCAGQLERKPVH